MLPQDTELAQQTNVPDVFGATTDDTAGLRIVSLYEVRRINIVGICCMLIVGNLLDSCVATKAVNPGAIMQVDMDKLEGQFDPEDAEGDT